MIEVPEEARDATGERRAHGVPRWNLLAGRPGSVRVPSSAVRKGVSPDPRRLICEPSGGESAVSLPSVGSDHVTPVLSVVTSASGRVTPANIPVYGRSRLCRVGTGGRERRAASRGGRGANAPAEPPACRNAGACPPTRKPDRSAADRREAANVRRSGRGAVSVKVTSDADGCGAVGCRVEWPVYRVERATGDVRVLCVGHVRGWLAR